MLLKTLDVKMRTVIMSASIKEADKLRSEMEGNPAVSLLGSVANEDELNLLSEFACPDLLVWHTGSINDSQIADSIGNFPAATYGMIVICENPVVVQKLIMSTTSQPVSCLMKNYGKGELTVLLNALKKKKNLSLAANFETPTTANTACLAVESMQLKRLGLQTLSEIHFVCIRDIMYCKASGSYTEFFLNDGTRIMTSTSIKRYEEMLALYGFFRAHKSFLINNLHVRRIIKTGYGFAEISDGTQIEISRRKKEGFLTFLLDQALTKD
jgi:DNA-binding LytR/AlgR family response regulator